MVMSGTWYTIAVHECQLCGYRFVAVWIDVDVDPKKAAASCTKCGRLAKPVSVSAIELRELLTESEYSSNEPDDAG